MIIKGRKRHRTDPQLILEFLVEGKVSTGIECYDITGAQPRIRGCTGLGQIVCSVINNV